ncbi:MAG: hypothetical protein WDZ35_09165 [Crocinitomicaceae bacterium]
MKKLLFIPLIAFSLLSWKLQAQIRDIKPVDGTVYFEEEEVPCIEVHIDPETKTTKKAWKDFLKDQFDVRLKGIGFLVNKEILRSEEVYMELMGSKPVYLYTRVTEDMNGSQMEVFMSVKGEGWVSSENNISQYDQLKKMVFNFLKIYLPQYYKNQVGDVEDRIKSLKKEIDDLEEGIDDLKNDIEAAKNKIETIQSEVEQKEIELRASKVEMEISLEKLKCRAEKLKKIMGMLDDL